MDTDLTEEQMSSVCQRKLRREVIGPPLKKWKIADWEGWLIAAIPDDIKITERERQRPL